MGITQTKRIEKVWVVTWAKGTTEEWKDEPQGPKDFESIGVEVIPEYTFDLRERGKTRKVLGFAQAVFMHKKEAQAYMEKSGMGEPSFTLRRAYLSIF